MRVPPPNGRCIRGPAGELRALLMGLSLGGLKPNSRSRGSLDQEVSMLMAEFDVNNDGSVSRDEFRTSLRRSRPPAHRPAARAVPAVLPRSAATRGARTAAPHPPHVLGHTPGASMSSWMALSACEARPRGFPTGSATAH